MMDVIKQYKGRKFIESEYYQPLVRYIAGLASNNVWLYTVDKVKEFNREKQSSGKTIIRIVRWRAINDKKDKNIKYWRFPRAYNIRSAGEWGVCSQIVDVLMDQKMSSDNFVLLPKGEYDNLLRQIDETAELSIKINRLRTVKSATQVELGLFKKKIRLMKANIKNYEKTLDAFESLVEKGNTTETNVHDYITEKKAFWLFGLEYVGIESKVGFPPSKRDYEFDIMLQRHDDFWDLVELKGPNENLFDKRTKRRNKPNKALSEAIGQVFTYLHVCDTINLKNILKPKAMIVIGKKKTDKLSERRIFSSYLNNVELITYTELLEQGKKLLGYIKSPTIGEGSIS